MTCAKTHHQTQVTRSCNKLIAMKIVETEIILITNQIILAYNFIAGSENITKGKRKRDVDTYPVGELVNTLIHATHLKEGDTIEESQRVVRIYQDHMLEEIQAIVVDTNRSAVMEELAARQPSDNSTAITHSSATLAMRSHHKKALDDEKSLTKPNEHQVTVTELLQELTNLHKSQKKRFPSYPDLIRDKIFSTDRETTGQYRCVI